MYKEAYIYSAEWLPLSANARTDYEIRTDSDADFEFIKTIHVATSDNFDLEYKDDTSGRFLNKGVMDARAVSSTVLSGISANGFIPFIWPRPYIISAASTFTVTATDNSGSNNTIRLSFHGSKLYPGNPPWIQNHYRAMLPYVYTTRATIAANGTDSLVIATDIDSDFMVYKLTGVRGGAALLTIKDGGRDREWMNRSVHIDNLIGNGQFPNILPSGRFIYRGSPIAITIQDLSGSSNAIELHFIGLKMFK